MKFTISPEVKELGINVCMAIIKDANTVNKNATLEKIKKETVARLQTLEISNSKILQGYRKLYDKAGINAIPPAESLINLIKTNHRLPNINTVVDCYNLVSAETLVSTGAHDTSQIKGNIRFVITNGYERYTPLDESKPIKVPAGEYACIDDDKILCRMDIKQCNETKITKETKEFIVYVQGNRYVTLEYLEEALQKVCSLIIEICGGTYEIIKE
ncbi:MAG: phenylalanine--tRNA ligase beta subunit-related protein [Nanoarchaeota archaeon]